MNREELTANLIFKTNPNDEQIVDMGIIAEKFFETDEDESQADPSLENSKKLIEIDGNTYIYITDKEKIIGWSCVLPTSKSSMELFLNKNVTEKEMFDISTKEYSFEALYLIAAVVLPEYRNKGLATSMMTQQIQYFKNQYGITDLYAYTLTVEGVRLIKKLENDLGAKIRTISKI